MPSFWDVNGNLVDGRYEIAGRTTKTIQTHNAVSVGATGYSAQTTWMDCNGFSDIQITMINDASTTSQVNVLWSNDGTNIQGKDFSVVPSNTFNQKAGTAKVKARYAKVELYNADAAAHTTSAWAYLTT